MDEELKRQIGAITDLFSGADGGAGFVKFQGLMAEMSRRAATGDTSASQVLDVVTRFSRLVALAERL